MKKKLSWLLIAITCLSVTACGNKGESNDVKKPSVFQKTWFEEYECKVTPQGNHILKTSQYERDEDVGMIDVPFKIKMSEETDGVDAGMKKVNFELVMDTSVVTAQDISFSCGMLDRYTGSMVHYVSDEHGFCDTEAPIDLPTSDGTVQVYYDDNPLFNYGEHTISYTGYLLCPESYDGAVYYIGYNDKKNCAKAMEMYYEDKIEFSYILSDYPGFEEQHDMFYYFSATDK